MKSIAILGMIYLPATFVCVCVLKQSSLPLTFSDISDADILLYGLFSMEWSKRQYDSSISRRLDIRACSSCLYIINNGHFSSLYNEQGQ